MGLVLDKIVFCPPPPSYTAKSFPSEFCVMGGVPCLCLASNSLASKVVIYCHGNAVDLGQKRKYLCRLRDYLGMHVFAVEYPGYGLNYGKPTEDSVYDAVRRVYSHAISKLNWPFESIIIMGRSIGSCPAILLASRYKVGALILISAFTKIQEIMQSRIGFAFEPSSDDFDNLKRISKVNCPILLIHGAADKLVPLQHSLDLYNACSQQNDSKKEICIFDNVGHNEFDWHKVHSVIDEFFAKVNVSEDYLPSPSPREFFGGVCCDDDELMYCT